MKQENKFDNIRIIYSLIGIVLILLAVLLLVGSLHLLKEPITEKEVKCYDKYSNEIIGEKCINIIDPEDDFGIMCIVAFYMALIGIGIIVTQINLIREEKENSNDK